MSLFQRGSFFSQTAATGINPDYQVSLKPIVASTFNVTITNPASFSGSCGTLWAIDLDSCDSYVQNTIFPALAQAGYDPTSFPMLLFYNVVMYIGSSGNCCVLGYHSAFDNPAFGGTFQTHGIVDYETSGAFDTSQISDTSVMSHELAEWMDDPSVGNATPTWGHIGQVSDYQGNLEVGDPLTGTLFPIVMPNGFTYHIQDLAFWPWFFDKPAPPLR